MNIYKIYGLKVIGDNEIRYIGLTKNSLTYRLRGHKKEKRRNPYKIKWVAKNKSEIEIVLLEDNIPDLKTANDREVYYIGLYRKNGSRLINLTNGGDGTQGFSSWNRGKNCTYIDKLIENSPRSKAVYVYDLNGIFICEYRSVKFASIKTGVVRQSISNIANMKPKYKQSGGFMFRWFKEDNIQPVFYDESLRLEKIRSSLNKSCREIKIEKDGIMAIYKNFRGASLSLGLSPRSISTYASRGVVSKKHGRFSYA